PNSSACDGKLTVLPSTRSKSPPSTSSPFWSCDPNPPSAVKKWSCSNGPSAPTHGSPFFGPDLPPEKFPWSHPGWDWASPASSNAASISPQVCARCQDPINSGVAVSVEEPNVPS